MIDKKGDTLEYPKVVRALPFWDSANTYFFNDDYTISCPGDYADQGGGKVPLYDFFPLALKIKPKSLDLRVLFSSDWWEMPR